MADIADDRMEGINASTTMIETLVMAGVSAFFVNLGSDHPGIIKALAEMSTAGSKHKLKVYTCPHEMVALAAAQGYAQVRKKPAAVFVHVDVGTQCLGGAVHNVDRCCVPVIIFAGQSPSTQHNEHLGSRNEFIHWLQDVPDQLSLVRQYMRYTAMIHSPLNAPEVVLRALTLANSEPKGPVYLSAMRETMEEHRSEASMRKHIPDNMKRWSIVRPRAVEQEDVQFIVTQLRQARYPVVITSSLGRDPKSVAKLVNLADRVALSVISSAPSSVCFPATHIGHIGFQYGPCPDRKLIQEADLILILDADIPWIPKLDSPNDDCVIVHIDRDPLKVRQNYYHFPVDRLVHADTGVALDQINEALSAPKYEATPHIEERKKQHLARRLELDSALDKEAAAPSSTGPNLTVPIIVDAVRRHFPRETLFLNESITNYGLVWSHLRADQPGCVLASGASSLGWGLGASIGAQIAFEEEGKDRERPIVLFSGDGCFLFGIPSVCYWLSRRYDKPFVTIVFNNGGWNAPKKSLTGVYNAKEQMEASLESLHLSFGGQNGEATPDYGGVAKASGGAACYKLTQYSELQHTLQEALQIVMKERRSVVLDCLVPRS